MGQPGATVAEQLALQRFASLVTFDPEEAHDTHAAMRRRDAARLGSEHR